MSRPNPFLLIFVFAAFITLFGGVTWLVGGLYLDTHEGDSFHLLDVLTRMERGDVPHLDFLTPIGALAFWPITYFIAADFPAGQAIILAQFMVAAVLLPVAVYIACTRLPRGWAIYFGCLVLALPAALSYGTATAGVGVSMHYNRWAWSVAFLVLALVLIPARGRSFAGVDGILAGLLVSALVLLKITYFVVMGPVVMLALWAMHGPRGALAACASGALVFVTVALVQGFGFWAAYLGDLIHVAGNEIRPYVGLSFDKIIAGPSHIAGTLIGVIAMLCLRQSLGTFAGLAVLILVPGFLYITYQNFGNDPLWLAFLPVLLWALRPPQETVRVLGWDAARVMGVLSVAALAVIFPSLFNIATSPLAHASVDRARFMPLLPADAGHRDVFIRADRAYTTTAQIFRDDAPGPWARFRDAAGRQDTHEFQGVRFQNCEWMAGSRAIFEVLGADLDAAGIAPGSYVFTADLLGAYWFFADVRPAPGSAPWYYGGLSGLDETDYVMIPKCGFVTHVRGVVLREMKASDYEFDLVRDNDLYALFRVTR
jgi:hypothetical protein